MSNYERVKAWRLANPEKYRESQRRLMERRRGSAEAPVVARPAQVSPVVVRAPESAPVVRETAAEKMARLMALGRSRVGQSPAAEAPAEPGAGRSLGFVPAPAGFRSWRADRQQSWVAANWPDIAGLDDADSLVAARLASVGA